MLLTLLWLSVGISFVYLEQQEHLAETACTIPDVPVDPDENTCPFDDTEEGSESYSNHFPAEYLQEDYQGITHSNIPVKHHKNRGNDAFIFFHVESFSPPPDILS